MIETRGLTFRYAGGRDLRFGDVTVPQGGMLLVSGASGAGKSTWLALVAGLLQPREGHVTVAGTALASLRGAALDAWRGHAIGFLPQRLHLSPHLSVARNLALAQFAVGAPQDFTLVARALAALGVEDLAQRMPGQISGGQALRVALARAVLLQPQVILADEPTASLDDDACRDALTLLHNTATTHGASLVIATHDTRVSHHFSDEKGLQRLQILRTQL